MSFQLTSAAKNTQLLSNVLSLYMSNDNMIHKNLSFVLDIIVNHRLFAETREPSEELASVYRKWTVRLNSLLQSKIVAARWCGIVLIRVTCENSHALLIDNAKTWSAQLLGFVGVNILKNVTKYVCYFGYLLFFLSLCAYVHIEIRASHYSPRSHSDTFIFIFIYCR